MRHGLVNLIRWYEARVTQPQHEAEWTGRSYTRRDCASGLVDLVVGDHAHENRGQWPKPIMSVSTIEWASQYCPSARGASCPEWLSQIM